MKLTGSMKNVLGVIILVAWGILAVASANANYSFGLTWGNTEQASQTIAWASVASDVMKAIFPIFVIYFWVKGAKWPMFCALVVSIVTICYSFVAAIGFASTARMAKSDKLTIEAHNTIDWKQELKRLKQKQSWYTSQRGRGAVEADMAKMQGTTRWKWTDGCNKSETNTAKSRAFCAEYKSLQAELITIAEGEKIDKKVAHARAMMQTAKNLSGDTQSEFLSDIFDITVSNATIGTMLLLVLLLELGSSLGLTVGLGVLRYRADDENDSDKKQETKVQPSNETVTPLTLRERAQDNFRIGVKAKVRQKPKAPPTDPLPSSGKRLVG